MTNEMQMPTETATAVAELAGYAAAVARLQAYVLFNVSACGLARNGEGVTGPSIIDCARTSELLARLSYDIVEIAGLYRLEAGEHDTWSRARPLEFTFAAAAAQNAATSATKR